MGEVTNVVLFDKETDGVASVRYSNALAATECVRVCCLPTPISPTHGGKPSRANLPSEAYIPADTRLLGSTQVMNGRHFSGMVVEAYIADGNEKFKKSSEKKAAAIEVEEEEEGEEEGRRLDQFGTWLEEETGAARE